MGSPVPPLEGNRAAGILLENPRKPLAHPDGPLQKGDTVTMNSTPGSTPRARSWRPTSLLVLSAVALLVPDPVPNVRAQSIAEHDIVRILAPAPAQFPLADALGKSGKLRALIGTPAALFESSALRSFFPSISLLAPGIHRLGLAAPDGDSLVVVSIVLYGEKKGATLEGYRVGNWPAAGLATRDSRYAPPAGFIRVTAGEWSTPVSENFRLGDFLTHDQQQVWPKFLVLKPLLVDKLELIGQELERRGLPSRLHVMSGFRTPQYNALEVGPNGGRAGHSRHMYGDAADVFVDADGNGNMDDLNHDGKVNVSDARVLFTAAEAVEADFPSLVGGLSAYPANSAHGPFVHVDVRGTRARW